MSQAKTMKLKEYNTDILSHTPANFNSEAKTVRLNGTFQSSVMDQTPEVVDRHAKSRERLALNRPLTASVTRTSYQDSNIFGYKDSFDGTV